MDKELPIRYIFMSSIQKMSQFWRACTRRIRVKVFTFKMLKGTKKYIYFFSCKYLQRTIAKNKIRNLNLWGIFILFFKDGQKVLDLKISKTICFEFLFIF